MSTPRAPTNEEIEAAAAKGAMHGDELRVVLYELLEHREHRPVIEVARSMADAEKRVADET